MTDYNRVVEGYFAVWNEEASERRRALIAKTWTEGATYLDPMLSGDGHDGIDRMIAAVHEKFPGHRFKPKGAVDGHADRVRFSWELVGPDGKGVGVAGTDFGVVAGDGRLAAITGFLDQAPVA